MGRGTFNVLLAALVVSAGAPSAWGNGVLTQAVQIVRLNPPQIAQAPAARLRGVVLSGAELGPNVLVLHDGTGVMYVRAAPPLPGGVARGDDVEVTGVVGAGEYAPVVEASGVRRLGPGRIPAALRVTYDQLFSGWIDARWAEVSGVVRSAAYLPGAYADKTVLEVATGGGRLVVEVAGQQLLADEWVDSEVTLRGICFYQFNQNRQLYDVVLVVPIGERIIREPSPVAPSFESPAVPISSLLQFSHQGSYGHRTHVEGVVMFQQPGEFLYLHDGERGLYVHTLQGDRVAAGRRVGVLGFVVRGEYSPMLEDAVFRLLPQEGVQVEPAPVERPEQALELDCELVRLQAMVVGHVQQPDGWALSLERDGMVFNAFLRTEPGRRPFPELLAGSAVEVTGICTVVMGYWVPQGGLRVPQTFRVLLRSPEDLRVLQAPPWWTRTRVVVALAGAVVLCGLITAGVVMMARWRLQQKQRERQQAEARFTAILAERNRVAREIHDTLAQDLAAVSAQLEVLRATLSGAGESVRDQLEQARRIVRGSLAEARRSIFNMRSQVLEKHDLAGALRDLLQQESRARNIETQMDVTGNVRRLAPAVENDLLRIGQEAIHNAVRHGQPRTIRVTLRFDLASVLLRVRDNGCGFVPEAGGRAKETHFGLVGMQERASQHGGRLRIDSAPGQGTEMTIEIPLH